MADERVSSFATPEFFEELKLAEDELAKVVQLIAEANQAGKRAEGFAVQAKTIKEVAVSADKLAAAQERQAKAAGNAATATVKAAQAEAKMIAELTNDYGMLSKAYNEAALRAKNYALQLGVAHPSTISAIKDAKDLSNQLKLLDFSVGQSNRNVGNYAGSMVGLQGSIQQLARELPSLSGGFAIFASAIGNNIAPAADALQRFRNEQKLLKAQGAQTQTVFSALSGAILNWQTLLLVGVTLLTVYGKEIGDFTKSLFAGKKVISAATLEMEAFNEALSSGAVKDQIASYKDLLYYIELSSKGLATEKQAVDKFNDSIGKRIGFETTLAGVKKAVIDKGSIYVDFLIEEARAQALVAKSVEATIKLRQKEEDIKQGKFTAGEALQGAIDILLFRDEKEDIHKKRNVDALKELEDQLANVDAALKASRTRQEELAKKGGISIIPLEEEKERKKKIKDLTDDLLKLQQTIKEFALTLSSPTKAELDAVFSEIEKGIQAASGSIETGIFDKHAEENAKKQAKALEDVLREHGKNKLRLTEEQKQKEADIRKRAEFIQQSALSVAGELNNFQQAMAARRIQELDAEIKKINEKRVADINAIEASTLSEEERRKRIAEINIAANAEEKRIDNERIQRQQRAARFDRAITIAQIIADTAAAVVKQLKATPLPAGIPFVAAVAALGAAKLATAVATPLPGFEKGTDSSPEGWAWTDEKGPEGYISPSGKFSIGQNKGPKLRYLERGTKIIPHEKLINMTALYGMGMSLDHIPQMDTSRLEKGIGRLENAILSQSQNQLSITGSGIRHFVHKGNSETEWIKNL